MKRTNARTTHLNLQRFKNITKGVDTNKVIIGLLVILGLVPIFLKNEFIIRLLTACLMYASLSMAFDFTNGYIKITNFGFAAFWGLGAYTSALLVTNLGMSPWLTIILGTLFSGLIGLGLGVLTLRLDGIFAACMTWFVALAMMGVALNWVELTNGSCGFSVPLLFDTNKNLPYFYVMLLITIFVYIVLTKVINSNAGLAFKAIGQNLNAAQSLGINATKYKILNFTLSCALAGLIGGFYAHFVGVLTPSVMETKNTVEIMAISFIGGRGTIWGGIVSAFILIPAMEYFKDYMQYRLIVYGLLMIAVMLYFPAGLAGAFSFLKMNFRKWFGVKDSDYAEVED